MFGLSTGVLILIAAAFALLLWLVSAYNGLVTLKTRTEEAWSDIDVQLKRRYDLIPNLVETVKGYASHESGTLENIVKARSAAMSAGNAHDKAVAENALSGTLKSLFALAENYPDLKASQNFHQMQLDLKDAEDKIQASRRFYNANVRDFNTRVMVFPTNIVAKQLGFAKYDFFEADATERENVKVQF